MRRLNDFFFERFAMLRGWLKQALIAENRLASPLGNKVRPNKTGYFYLDTPTQSSMHANSVRKSVNCWCLSVFTRTVPWR